MIFDTHGIHDREYVQVPSKESEHYCLTIDISVEIKIIFNQEPCSRYKVALLSGSACFGNKPFGRSDSTSYVTGGYLFPLVRSLILIETNVAVDTIKGLGGERATAPFLGQARRLRKSIKG
jgi:hypothetical protein